MLERGDPPRCWRCEQLQPDPDAAEALELHGLLELGMSWELALTAMHWTGTADELRALAGRVAVIRDELQRKDT